MKIRQTVESREPRVESQSKTGSRIFRPRLSTLVARPAFTLVELLTVIAIIGIVAAMIFPVARTVKRQTIVHSAQAQMAQLQTALERYKSVYGFYPPGSAWALTNQLYFELEGTFPTNIGGANYYMTLDHVSRIPVILLGSAFGAGVGGFMNCEKPGAPPDAPHAEDFLTDLNSNQYSTVLINTSGGTGGTAVNLLVTPVGGPDSTYTPVGTWLPDVNPWRYAYPGTKNPGSYDLWIQLQIAGRTNLVCNWTKTVEINTSDP
jgi:prepilin-type N-terminal cleavage/methylation domain-containing protein